MVTVSELGIPFECRSSLSRRIPAACLQAVSNKGD